MPDEIYCHQPMPLPSRISSLKSSRSLALSPKLLWNWPGANFVIDFPSLENRPSKEIMAFGGKSLNFPLKTAISLIFGRLLAPWPKTHQILGKLASKREKCKLFWPFGPKITTFSTFDGFFPSFLEILLDFYYFALFGKIM